MPIDELTALRDAALKERAEREEAKRNAQKRLAEMMFRQTQPKDPGPRIRLCGEATSNPAIAAWAETFNREYRQSVLQGNMNCIAEINAGRIAIGALPPLTSISNIRDFIACIAYALAFDVLQVTTATRLLQAARLAHLHLRQEAAAEDKPRPGRRRGPYRKPPATAAKAEASAEIEIPATGTES